MLLQFIDHVALLSTGQDRRVCACALACVCVCVTVLTGLDHRYPDFMLAAKLLARFIATNRCFEFLDGVFRREQCVPSGL